MDEADGTALSTRAEQCALGSLQNLHAIEIEDQRPRIGSRDNTVVEADLDGHVIDVDPRGGVTGDAGGYAPYRKCDGRTRILKVHSRCYRSDIRHIHDLSLQHFVAAENRDADRHLVQGLLALLRGHDHLLELIGSRQVAARIICARNFDSTRRQGRDHPRSDYPIRQASGGMVCTEHRDHGHVPCLRNGTGSRAPRRDGQSNTLYM